LRPPPKADIGQDFNDQCLNSHPTPFNVLV
jgi:hypothetical protein